MSFRAFGRGAETDLTNSVTDASGRASVKWLLGTNAAETQELSIWVWSKRSEPTLIALHARALPAAPARVAFEVDSLVFPLGATANVGARAWDAFNNEIDRGAIRFDVLDTALVFISSRGTAYPLHRGRTRIMASIGKAADTLPVTVYQRVDRLGVAGDSIVLLALGAIAPLTVTIADERGLPVRDTVPVISITDTAIVALEGESAPTMRARANGRTMVRLALGAVKSDVPVIVNQRPTSVSIVTYRRTLTAIGDTLRLRAELLDSLGSPISGRTPAYSSSDSSVVRVTQTGLLTALAEGRAVVTGASAEAADTVTIAVEPLPATLEYETSTIELVAIGSRASSRAIVRDRLGTVIQRVRPRFQSSRPLVATVDTAGTIMSAGNGVAQVVATLDSLADTLTVTVAQRARYLEFTSDTIVLDALQQTRTIGAIAFDENGYRVPGAPSSVVIEDTSIARVRAGGELLSIQNGTTRASFTLAGLAASVPVVVEQRPSTIRIENTEIGTEIFLAPLHTALPIRCTAFDRNGFQVAARLVAVPRANSVYEGGTTCDSLRLARSGADTIVVRAGDAEGRLPFAAAVRAVFNEQGPGSALILSGGPSGEYLWAPTLRRNSGGEFELYLASYRYLDDGTQIGDLHRWLSPDGVRFSWDGIAVSRDSVSCAPRGSGIENVAIVKRNDGPGWRMFFGGGSFECYGWQVFSAVSEDEKTWMVEPGVRLGNGGSLESPAQGPWPVGEGMTVDQLPTGEWRMIVGGYEQATPAYGTWLAVEWRSSDQLNWRYLRTVVRPEDVPSETLNHVYSPVVTEIGRGVYRMIFAGDDRNGPDPSYHIFSAVSRDLQTWQHEGEFFPAPGWELRYATLAGNRLVFLRRRAGTSDRFEVAAVSVVQR